MVVPLFYYNKKRGYFTFYNNRLVSKLMCYVVHTSTTIVCKSGGSGRGVVSHFFNITSGNLTFYIMADKRTMSRLTHLGENSFDKKCQK